MSEKGNDLLTARLKKLNFFWHHLTFRIILVPLMWKWVFLILVKKPSFKMTGIAFLFWIGLGPARWIIALILFFSFLTRSMKLLSFEVVLYLYKFIITFRMEYSSLRKKFRIRSYSGPYFPAFFPYSVWMRKNTDQNNSEYELFSRSDSHDCTGAPNY